MTQAILQSVQPEWLSKILNLEKILEFRKTKPNCLLPIDVYLICSKAKPFLCFEEGDYDDGDMPMSFHQYSLFNSKKELADCDELPLNGKVVAKFTLKEVEDLRKYEWARKDDHFYDILKDACLTEQGLQDYCPLKNGETRPLWAWHIDDLVIFDKPKELGEFHPYFPKPERWCHEDSDCDGCPFFVSEDEECKWLKGLSKAPQSWQYVEVSQ